jgi:NhaP-type Na+/H+ or K+/H+ antiporter
MADASPWITMPWALRPDTLLGAALLLLIAALIGELAWRLLRWPRLMGPVLVGTVLAVAGVGARGSEPALRIAVDMALALLLFEAGARADLRWLRRNPWLLATGALEALGAGLAVLLAARAMGLPPEVAAPLALIAIGVSPAVVQRVAGDGQAAGQVTERLILLSTLNTLVAIVGLKMLSAGVLLSDPDTWLDALPAVLFSFFGSFLLGVALGEGVALVARRFDLRDDNAAVMVLAGVLLALVAAKTLQLSTLLVPLAAGLWLRFRYDRPWVWPRHFGSAGAVLVLVTFVAVASAWSPAVLISGGLTALVLLLARAAAKGLAVMALATPSGLGWRQAGGLSAALLPLSATAWVMGLDFALRHPVAGAAMLPLLLAMLALTELAAPLVVRAALRFAGDIEPRPPGGGDR